MVKYPLFYGCVISHGFLNAVLIIDIYIYIYIYIYSLHRKQSCRAENILLYLFEKNDHVINSLPFDIFKHDHVLYSRYYTKKSYFNQERVFYCFGM